MASPSNTTANNTQELVSSAALRLFATKGFAGTGIRDVARDAGVTTASLYHYIGTKEDLLHRLICDGLVDLLSDAKAALQEATTPVEEIAALVRAHVNYQISYPLLATVIDGQFESLTLDRRSEVLVLRRTYEDEWRKAIGRGVEDGTFRVRHPSLARLALLEMCNGVVSWYSPSGSLTVEGIAEEFTQIALRVLGTSSDPSSAEEKRGRKTTLRGAGKPPNRTGEANVARKAQRTRR